MTTIVCPVVEVSSWARHPNADTLSITHVFGNCVIFKTDDFVNPCPHCHHDGMVEKMLVDEPDLKGSTLVECEVCSTPGSGYSPHSYFRAVYIPEEALVPEEPRWAFMWAQRTKEGKEVREKDRIVRAKRLRGIFSCGILVKVPEGGYPVGTDLAPILGITKYEQPEQVSLGGDNEAAPEWFQRYTDIENARGPLFRAQPDRARYSVLEGKDVIITEKIHGCLRYGQKIRMIDGKTKPIQQILVGDLVLGVDSTGNIVPSKVTNVFNNGRAEKWLRVRTRRAKCGQGNRFTYVIATPNHLFWSPKRNTYIPLSEVKPGDTVAVVRSDLTLTPLQKQILLGMLLGDASFIPGPINTASVLFGHVERHREYMDYILRGLGGLGGWSNTVKSGYGSTILRGRTVQSYFVHQAFASFIKDGIKIVPSWVADELSPISLAFWYMDDGSLGHHEAQEDRAHFAVCGFDEASCQILLKALKRFGVVGVLYGTDKRRRIRLNAEEAEKLFLLVAPYIPQCMQYKLPERYRGHLPFLLSSPSEYKTWLCEKEVVTIEDVTATTHSCRYDIETETHNFFCPDVLVHNSNARFTWVGDRMWVGSHNNAKKLDGTSVWNQVAKRYGLEEICQEYRDYIFYGEIYGPIQKGYHYGQKHASFVLFDIFDLKTHQWLPWDTVCSIAFAEGLPIVPELYRGPWVSLEHASQFADGPTVLGKGVHNREGCVVRADPEAWDEFLGRVTVKIIGEEYLLKKGTRMKHPR